MKKLVLILAIGVFVTSCQWFAQTFKSTEGCITWYLDSLADAVEDNDVEKFQSLIDGLAEYVQDLDENKISVAIFAVEQWYDENEDAYDKIEDFVYDNDINDPADIL